MGKIVIETGIGSNISIEIDSLNIPDTLSCSTALIKAIAEKLGENPIELAEMHINALKYEKARIAGVSEEEALKLYGSNK